jgi:alanyl aminopeptidase
MKPKHPCIWLILLSVMTTSAFAKEVEYRLGKYIKPSFQQITLKIDPDQPTFSGETTITIDVTKASQKIGFYERDIDVLSVELIDGDKRIPLNLSEADYDIHHAFAEHIIPPKRYKLHIVFSGKINTTSDGMYLSTFEERNYVFTQFEDMHARRAFPSFDEPHFKIPYQVTISAPEKHTVLSNTPVFKQNIENGWKTVEFKKTKPMPTYLVAYAVGEMDSAEITGLSVPGKIYTPKGQAHRTKFAVKHTPKILKTLESYFGSAYPYEKLDFVAVPNFTHGAMENAGLVTYRSSLLLLDDEPRLTAQTGPLNVIAHELAHMWYGNLVTMAWWDDLWLNEAFASWMATKVMMTLYPEQNFQSNLVQESAFGADASPTTKAIKKVVRSQTDVMDGLGLNYTKGESVLQLIESLVGEKEFQQGVQKYMQKHAWRNTEADDLWEILSTVADFDVPGMMKTYLQQPSYPLVEFADNGKISQSRYRLAGAKVDEQVWTIPLSISYKKKGKIERTSLFLKDKETLVGDLAEAQWIFPNDNAMGYMRWKIPATQLSALLKDIDALNGREKKSVLYNSDALLKAGEVSLAQHMAVLDALAGSNDPMIARAVVSSLNDFVYLIDQTNEVSFGKFLEAKLMPWFTRLGTTEGSNDSKDISRLRTSVFTMLGQYSKNEAVQKEAIKVTEKYLSDPSSVARSVAYAAMRSVAKHGDLSWFDKFEAAYLLTSDANIQSAIRYSMRFSQAENVEKALNFTLSEHVGPADTIGLLSVAGSNQQTSDILYTWLETHMIEVAKKMPAFHIARMPEYISSSCSTHDIELAKVFYKDKMVNYEGMQRSYDVALDESQQCLALKQLNQQTFSDYLSTAFSK